MARKIQDRTKRLSYVSRNFRNSEKEMDIVSSDDDVDDVPVRKKVRNEFSVLELRKDSEHFETDEDHIYSKSKEVEEIPEKKVGALRRGCVTRSSASSKSREEDFEEETCKTRRIEDYVPSVKRPKCSSKNAVMARINRMKKKQYISSLENSNKDLQEQNDKLTQNVKKQEKTIEALKHEVTYLKSLLANSKEISEILKNLKNSTGLPVSSSLQTVVPEEISDKYPHNQNVKAEKNINEGRANVKRVTSGLNFPILQDDVNLGDYSSNDYIEDEFSKTMDEESYFSFSGESDLSLDGILFNEDNFDFGASMFDYPVEKEIKTEENDIKEEESFKTPDLNKLESDVGLCLHINKRKISVELCSICNSRAQSQCVELNNS